MNTFDIVILVLLIVAFVRGFMKGFFIEIASLIALIGGVYGAIYFSSFASNIIENYVQWDKNYIKLASFVVTFIGIVILVSSLGKALTKMADFVALGFVNKILGGVFALLKSLIIISVALVFFSKINNTISFVKKENLENSALYKPLNSITQFIFPLITKKFKTEISNVNPPQSLNSISTQNNNRL